MQKKYWALTALLVLPLACLVHSSKAQEFALSSAPETATTAATSTLPSLPDNIGGQSTTTPTSTPPSTSGGGQSTSTPTSTPDQITLTIRDATITAFSGLVDLAASGTPDLQILPSNGPTTIAVPARSVLGMLETLQASSTTFKITDAAYFLNYQEFLVNCIAVPAGNPSPDCFNWTDVVDGSYPQVGWNHQFLNNGDIVFVYFGSPHKTVLSKSTVTAGEPFTAAAQQYDLPTGNYIPLTGVTLGVGTPNPDFTFTELATSTVDSNGQANFTMNATGTLAVGIKEDHYFPTAALTVIASTTPTSTPPSNGGGGGATPTHFNFDIPNALSFIFKNQNADGTFDSPLSTDWTAVAFGATDPGAAKTKLKTYLLGAKPQMGPVSDYERHAMALEALGINPYSGTAVDYITPIVKAFDGKQIGIADDNDDIFALIALQHAGYTSGDSIIQQEAAFVLSTQNKDGSWDESPDLTAAAIQALGPLFDISGVNQALGPAAGYLATTEQADGSWGNIDSTSWVQTAINGIIEAHTPGFSDESPWTSKSGFYPTDALAKAQNPDGGVTSPTSRIWSTSYAVAAASGKSWFSILGMFPKAAASGGNGDNAAPTSPTSTTTPTSTLPSLTLVTPTSTPATTTLATVTTITGTTTPATTVPAVVTITALRQKSLKLKIKKTIEVPKPAVLGTSTEQTVTLPPSPPPQSPAEHLGFFARTWREITGFFKWIF